jgi:uncharacterized repeat protein (TIGR01451 family)
MTSKTITTFLVSTAAALLLAGPVYADNTCTDQYGATTSCQPTNLNINKKVQDPTLVAPTPMPGQSLPIDVNYVENITNPITYPDGKVNFELIVTNNSGETFNNVVITDNVPDNIVVDSVTTDQKSDNTTVTISNSNKNVEVKFNNLTVNQVARVFVMTHLVGAYPNGDFCRDNWAKVTASARPNGDTNFARFCVKNTTTGVTKLPTAGVEDLAYIIPFAISGLGGLALLRKGKKTI